MSGSHPSRGTYLFAALAGVAAGAHLLWITWSGSPGLQVPAPIAYTAAWVFLLGGVRALQMAWAPESPGDGLAALIAGGLTVIGAWIAVGPGPRTCTAGSSGRAIGQLSGLECRVPFGVGAVLAGLIAVYAVRRWNRSRTNRGR